MASQLFQITNRKVIKDGSATGTYNSTPAVVQAKNGDWILSYNVGINHVTTTYHALRRSGDQGFTWGPEIAQWPANSPDPTLASMPVSGDLLVEFGKPNLQSVNGAAYARSTDNGYTWGKFTFFDNPVSDTSFTPTRYLNIGTTVYAPAYGPYVTHDGSDDAILWVSTDDGLTWTKRSTVRQVGDAGINESSIAQTGPTQLLMISRDDAGTHTWAHISNDLGVTWGSQVDYTPQVGVLQLPQLLQVGNVLLLFGRNPSNNTLVVYSSTDNGTTFQNGTVLDTYAGLSIDGAYCWPMLMNNGNVFVTYYADSKGLRLPDIKSLTLLMNPEAEMTITNPNAILRRYTDPNGATLAQINGDGTITSPSIPVINQPGQGFFIGPGLPGSNVANSSATSLSPTGSTNQVSCVQFVLHEYWTIRHVTYGAIAAGAAGAKFAIGIYSADGSTKLLEAQFDATILTPQSVSVNVTLPPGVYWYAWAANDTTATGNICPNFGVNTGQVWIKYVNNVVPHFGKSSNVLTAGVLPSTLGTITADGGTTAPGQDVPMAVFEP